MQTIAYPIGKSLYLNITNRCTNDCSFCIRNKSRMFNQEHALWLEHEPSAEEILAAIGDPSKYEEIVFCGYGEPLLRLDVVKAIANKLKSQSSCLPARMAKVKIRINTNGQANLFWGRDIVPELKGLIDAVSVSLNAEASNKHLEICNSKFGDKAYAAVLDFIKQAKKYIPKVELSVVDLPGIDKKHCEKIAKQIGVDFRVRPYYEETYIS